MTVKSIVEIDVRDEAWKNFQKSFQKYQEAVAHGGSAWVKVQASFAAHKKQLGSMPGTWGSIGKAANAATQPFIKIAAAASVMNARLKAAPTYMGKLKIIAQSTIGVVDKIAKGAFSIAKNIGKATLALLKWGGLASIFSGLLGGVGLFGIDRLALSAANQRRQSQGLGVGASELKSAQINFSKFTDVDSTLESIANTRSDMGKRWIFSALGINPNQGSNVDVMAASLKAAKHSFEQNGMTQQGAEAHGLTQLFSMDDLRRLHAMTDQEIDDAVRKQQADKRTLAVSDDTLRGWQALSIQLDKAGSQIGNILITKLSGLAGPLSTLSGAVADAIGTLANDKDLPGFLQMLGDKIKEFAKYLASPQFKSDMQDFTDNVKKVAGALKDLFGWIYDKLTMLGIVKPASSLNKDAATLGPGEQFVDANGNALPASSDPEGDAVRAHWKRAVNLPRDTANRFTDWIASKTQKLLGDPAYFGDMEKKYGLPAGLLGRIQHVESRGNPFAVSPRGAKGPFQIMDATATQYGLADPFNQHDSADVAARIIRDLMKKYKGNVEKAEAAYNWGQGNLDKSLADPNHKGDWHQYLPKETRDYIAKLMPQDSREMAQSVPSNQVATGRITPQRPTPPMYVEIRNNTGGSAIVTINALAQ